MTLDQFFSTDSFFPSTSIQGRLCWVSSNTASDKPTYPPCDVFIQNGRILLNVAVAGYDPDKLNVEMVGGVLHIKGDKIPVDDSVQFISRGISRKAFHLTFDVESGHEVSEVSYNNGILTIVMDETKDHRKTFKIKR